MLVSVDTNVIIRNEYGMAICLQLFSEEIKYFIFKWISADLNGKHHVWNNPDN